MSTKEDIVRALSIIATQLETLSENVKSLQRTMDNDIVPVLGRTSDRVGELNGRLIEEANRTGERVKNVDQRLQVLEARVRA